MRNGRTVGCFDAPRRIQIFQLIRTDFRKQWATKSLILQCLRERIDFLLWIAIRSGNWTEGKPRVGANAG